MNINLHNYEAWFLDYMEGNLNEQQVADLLLFLENHPDLKKEFDQDFSDISLEPEELTFNLKDNLKKPMLINCATVDDFMIAENEGLLGLNEIKELDEYVVENHLENDRKLYKAVYLQKTNAFKFPNKQKLKKGGITIPLFIRYAAAAAILLLITFAWLLNRNENSTQNQYAVEDVTEPKQQNQELKNILPVLTEENIAETPFTKNESNTQLASTSETPNSHKIVNPDKTVIKTETEPKIFARSLDNGINTVAVSAYDIFTANPTTLAINQAKIDDPTLLKENIIPNNKKNFSSAKEYTIIQYAGIKFKEKVLGAKDSDDAKIREIDIARAFASGINKISNNEVIAFQDHSQNDMIAYGIKIGKLGFTRSAQRD